MMLKNHLFIFKLLFCMVVVATEGKMKAQKSSYTYANVCDAQYSEVIYCYCNFEDYNSALEGRCWLYNEPAEDAVIWEDFSSQLKMKNLTLIITHNTTLKFIPLVAFHHLPSLEYFQVQRANLNTLGPYSFKHFTSLSTILLPRNSIELLEYNAFADLTDLSKMDLSVNKIRVINRHVFVRLPNLKELRIDYNNITTLQDRAFRDLGGLLELNLSFNHIQVITPDTFAGLTSLEVLDLHSNHIEIIGDNTFENLPELRELYLHNNSLEYIAPNAFQGLSQLKILELQKNKLRELGEAVFKHSPNIHHLNLRENALETLLCQTFLNLLEEEGITMFYLEENKFKCDTRLIWLFDLRKSNSSALRRDIEYVFCYFKNGTLPKRLNGRTIPPISEDNNPGPMVKLFDLLESELPDPEAWTQTANPVDDDTEQMQQEIHNKDVKNDKAPINDVIHSDKGNKGNHSFSPAQGEYGRGSSAASDNIMLSLGIITHYCVFFLLHLH